MRKHLPNVLFLERAGEREVVLIAAQPTGGSPVPRRRGFTLMEILIATTAFLVLIAALYSVFYGTMRLRERTFSNVEDGLPRDYVLAILRRDLAAVVPPVGLLAGPMIGQTDASNLGRNDRLQIHTATGIVSDDAPWGDIQRIEYYLAEPDEDSDARGMDLVRATTRNLLASVEEEPEEERLLHNVATLEITYYDGEQWLDTWDSTTQENATPLAVRMRIALAPAGENETAPAPPLEATCEIAAKAREAETPAAAATPSAPGPQS